MTRGGGVRATARAPCGVALAIVVAVTLAACARAPMQLGSGAGARTAPAPAEPLIISPPVERALGSEQAAQVMRTMGLVERPELAGWVNAVGQRLAVHAPGDARYRFFVVDVPEPNAFALPGGWIYVSRGLLALVNSEDELACVMGHEIGHVVARHAARRIEQAAPLARDAGPDTAAGATAPPRLDQATAGSSRRAIAAALAPYGREQEREADRIGQQLAAAAGWDPAALVRILTTIERDEALAGRHGGPRFLATHPSTGDRIQAVTADAATLACVPQPPIAGDRAAVLALLDGLVLGGTAAHGVIDGPHFLHPDLDFAITFPAGWTIYEQRTNVAATAADERALIVVGLAGPGADPVAAARAFALSTQVPLRDVRPLRQHRLRAAHAEAVVQAKDGPAVLDLAWIVHRGLVFEILGVTSPSDYEQHGAAMRAAAESFRPLTARERGSFEETRLRIHAVRPGESLADFAARTASRWTPAQIAIANGLDEGVTPPAGALLKIAHRERYRPATSEGARSAAPSADADLVGHAAACARSARGAARLAARGAQ